MVSKDLMGYLIMLLVVVGGVFLADWLKTRIAA